MWIIPNTAITTVTIKTTHTPTIIIMKILTKK